MVFVSVATSDRNALLDWVWRLTNGIFTLKVAEGGKSDTRDPGHSRM